MNTKRIIIICIGLLAWLLADTSAMAQSAGTGFTYQGRIKQNDLLLSGPVEFQFSLFASPAGNDQIGATLPFTGGNAIMVNQGLFHAVLDFGDGAFDGSARWLELQVRPDGGGWTLVSPRQMLSPAPYAVHAVNSMGNLLINGQNTYLSVGNLGIGTNMPGMKLDVAGGSIRTDEQLISTAAQGTPPLAVASTTMVENLNVQMLNGQELSAFGRLGQSQTWTAANTFSNSSNSFTGTFSGSGAGVTGVNAALLGSQNSSFYRNAGNLNAGTVPNARISGSYSGITSLTATSFSGNGSNLTSLNASNLSSGTVPNGVISGSYSGITSLTSGTLNAEDLFVTSGTQTYNISVGNDDRFRIRDTNNGSTRLVIATDGKVGIGLFDPSALLHVNGNIRATNNVIADGNCCGSSDLRFKRNFSPFTKPLESILSMNGVRYEWRMDEFPGRFQPGEFIGFIAQEVRDIVPEIVVEDEDGYLAVDYGRLTPVLVEAIKELNDIVLDQDAYIAQQDATLEAQQRQINELAAQIAAMERKMARFASHLE